MSAQTFATMPVDESSVASPEVLRPPSNRLVVVNAFVKGVAAVLALGLQIVLVKLLGETDYGAYVLFITYCSVLSILGKGGLDLLSLRYFAVASSSVETRVLRSVRSRALAYATLCSLLVVGLAQLLRFVPGLGLRFGGGSTVAWMIVAVLSASLLAVLSGMLRGMRRVLLSDSLDSVVRPVLLLLIAFVAVRLTSVSGLSAGLAAFVGSNTLVGAVVLVLVGSAINKPSRAQVQLGSGSPFRARSALVLIASGLVWYGLFQLDTLLVGLYLGERTVAAYAMACNFVRIVIFIALIVSAQSQPLIAAASGSGQADAVMRITRRALRNSFVAAVVGVIILVVLGRPLLRVVSAGFESAYSALVVLSVAHLANSVVIILSAALVMCRREAAALWAQAAGLCVCIPLLFALVPRLGQLGAAVAVLAALVVVMSIVAIRARDLYWPRNQPRRSPEVPA